MMASTSTSAPRLPPRKRRPLLIFLVAALVVLAAIAGGVAWYASTPKFEATVRHRLVATLEQATGGRVELGSFQWHLIRLEFEADNLTIHGLEAPGEIPYAHIDRLFVRAKIISFFRAKAGLNLLQGDHPVFHLIVYPDGSTNQPKPKTVEHHGSVTDTLFDLAVDRTEITNGVLLLNQRAIPFDLAANDLGVTIEYDRVRGHYLADLRAADITAQRGKLAPVRSRLTLKADLSRTGAVLSQLQLQTGNSPRQGSLLEASGSLQNYADPQIDFSARGSVDVREIEALTAVPGLESGIAELRLTAKGNLSSFTVDGNAKVLAAAYRIPEVQVSGVNGSADIHITQDEIALTALRARLPEGGSLEGELRLMNWLAPTAAAPTRKEAVAAVAKKSQNLPAPPVGQVTTGSVRAQIRDVTLRSVMRMVAPQRYRDLGFDTSASGPVSVQWTGGAADAKVTAKVALAAGSGRDGVPVSGAVDATYDNRRGAVDIRNLTAQTPGSHIQVQGALGVYPPQRPSAIQADLVTTNLGEFDKTLAVLGVSTDTQEGKKTGVAVIPVRLHGSAEFHGTVSGNLLFPDVKGHLTASNFDTVFESAAGPGEVASPQASVVETAAASHASDSTTTNPEQASTTPPVSTMSDLHWDSLDAQAEYSPEGITVQQATLARGKSTAHVSGELRAHQISRHRNVFDDDSVLNATVNVQNASVTDLLTIAGSNAPVTGTLNLQARVGGTLGNLNGGGHVTIQGGEFEGQAYRSLNTDLKFTGHELDATNLEFLLDGGQITGDGGYDLRAETIHFEAKGSGFELEHIPQIQTPRLSLAGQLDFQASGSGPLRSPTAQATVHVSKVVVNEQFKGNLGANIHLDRNLLTYKVDSSLDFATLQLSGQTSITGDYPTRAQLSAENLHIGRLLRLYNVKDVSSESVLTLQAAVNGPARLPKQMEGTLDINKFAISVEGLALHSEADLTAQLRGGVLHLDPLRIVGDDTNLQVQGSAAILDRPQTLQLYAKGAANLKLAQSFDPNISSSGHMDFSVAATGTIDLPNLTGQVRFADVAISLGDLPNGLSQINGTLAFDQDRLTVQELTAVTGGGRLQLGGFITYQQGLYGDLTATGKDIRLRYPQGVSSMADAKLRLQGTETNLLLSGNVLLTRFSISPNLDLAALKSSTNTVAPLPDPNAPSNHVRLDVHITSAPELNFQNSFAKLAGDVDLRVRGTVASPSLLGHISITDGSANFAGTNYQLERGEIYFSNPIQIDPIIDLDATARVEDYDIDIGVHGPLSKLNLTYRSEPPLPEADVFALLALGRTQEEQQIYSQEQQVAGVNSTADALLGGALNATVSNRVSKLFGVGSVKIDPNFVGNLGNSSARITVEEKISKNLTITYATNINSTAEQLIAGQLSLTQNVSIVAQRDESGVFSLILKIHQRRR
jgi:translocation and assembly module TamB